MRDRLTLLIERAWTQPPRWRWLLWPLELLFAALTALRRLAFRRGWFASLHPGVPVIVVGNITAGGTGKTPVVIGLARALAERGLCVGVVSRGYGGSARGTLRVSRQTAASESGDEALLLARETDALVFVGRDRAAAAGAAVDAGVDVIVSDDGLQHYRLARDIEVVTMDARAGFGNGHLLPLGPLREPRRRLATVDFLLQRDGTDRHSGMSYAPRHFRRLGSEELRRVDEPGFGPRIHAVAAIAQPGRFFDTLRDLGLDPVEHAFADHRPLSPENFADMADLPVVMTAKDAVKCSFDLPGEAWVLEVDVQFPEGFVERLLERAGLQGAAADKPAPPAGLNAEGAA